MLLTSNIVEIDGSYLEAGGQIIRTGAALSTITKNPVKIYNIRAGRKKPGLMTQHLEGLKALGRLCNAEIKGAFLESIKIEFYPKEISQKILEINIPTAGSIGLIFQILKLPACFSEKTIEIKIKGGATFGKFAPPVLYMKNVLLPILEKMNYKAEINILKHGFYPKGGAEVNIKVFPCKQFRPLGLTERKELKSIKGISVASDSLKNKKVAERQEESARNIIKEVLGIEPEIEIKYDKTICPGSGIVLFANYENTVLGSDGLGELGKPAERVGEEAASQLIKGIKSNACLDRFMADQILPFLALTDSGKISVAEITNHCLTNIWVIEKFVPVKFEVKGEKGCPGTISVKKV